MYFEQLKISIRSLLVLSVLTGILYVETGRETLHDMMNTVD